jgi:hypothetical protein
MPTYHDQLLAVVAEVLDTWPAASPYFYGTHVAEGATLAHGGWVLFLSPCMDIAPKGDTHATIGLYREDDYNDGGEPVDLIDVPIAEAAAAFSYLVEAAPIVA